MLQKMFSNRINVYFPKLNTLMLYFELFEYKFTPNLTSQFKNHT